MIHRPTKFHCLTPTQREAVISAIVANQEAPEGHRVRLDALAGRLGISLGPLYRIWRRFAGGESPCAILRRKSVSGTMKLKGGYGLGGVIPATACRAAGFKAGQTVRYTVSNGTILIEAQPYRR